MYFFGFGQGGEQRFNDFLIQGKLLMLLFPIARCRTGLVLTGIERVNRDLRANVRVKGDARSIVRANRSNVMVNPDLRSDAM